MRYAVRIKPTHDFDDALSVVGRFGAIYAVVREICLIGLDTDATAISYLRDYPGIEAITEDVQSSTNGAAPNDPAWSGMWFASALGLLDAWDISTGEGVKVAVLDSGVNATHVDFSGKLLPGWCVITNTDTVTSVNVHGTYTTSIIVAKANNGAGAVGIAHGSMGIPIRVSTASDGASSDVYLAAGVIKAVELGARVISVSYTGLHDNPSFLLAAEYARRNGAVVIGAMDNAVTTITADASKGKDVIFVSGINSSFNRVYSNGSILWIRAPQGIPVASGTGSSYISSFAGNSAAAPVVAGVCALILAIRPDLGPADLRQILAQSANKKIISGSTGVYTTTDGHGLIDALGALKLAQIWRPVGAESPNVVFASPKSYQTFFEGEAVPVEIAAQDDVSISKVELYSGGTLLSTVYSAPFSFSVIGLTNGLHKLTAIAYDDLGQNSQSADLWVRIALSVDVASVSDYEYALPDLTGNGEYEIRARFTNFGGAGPWSDWVQYEAPDDSVESVSNHFVEFVENEWRVRYTHPHAGQQLQYRFAGGDWLQVLENPLSLAGLKGSGDLELRVANTTSSSPVTLVGSFNLNRIHYVIYDSALPEPTAAQIKAGVNALGVSASASGSEEARLTTGLQTFLSAAAGLVPDQSYRIAFVGTDGVGLSNVVVSEPWTTLSDGTMVRAIILQNGSIYVLPTGQEGTGKKPIVLHEGTLRERLWVEGIPVVLENGDLRTVEPHETLVI